MSKRIGLYGGTFDPPHFGHLHLANEMMSRHDLDEVWFIPAATAPHKQGRKTASAAHRMAMVERLVEGLPKFRVLDIEVQRGGTSYTIDTINEILANPKLSEGCQFFLIMTDEYIEDFPNWKGMEEIVEKTTLLIGRRSAEKSPPPPTGMPAVDVAVKKGLNEMAVLEIRATDIRDRVAKGLSCRHLAPASVLSYLYENQLYKE